MSTYSLESLLQWMRDPDSNVLWGWNAMAALDRSKANLILLQEYIARFGSDHYLPVINEPVELVTGYFLEALHDFQLDIPRLSFENTDLERSKAKLSMALLGGVQLSQRRGVDNWYITRIVENDPLLGPWLYLDLNLHDVPGTVGQEGEVRLDLRESSDFRLTFGTSEYEQVRGGEAIQKLFEGLNGDDRFLVLGSIETGDDPLFRPQSFKLRTLSKGASIDIGDGALLILIRAEGSAEGGLIGESFRYPIPNDAGKDYSAAVLLDGPAIKNRLPLVEQVLEALNPLISGGQFDTHHNAHGRMESAVARAGRLEFNTDMSSLGPFPFINEMITALVYRLDVALPATTEAPLSLQLEANGQVSIRWATLSVVPYLIQYESSDPSASHPQHFVRYLYDVNLSGTYDIVEIDNDLVLKPVEWSLDIHGEEIEVSGQSEAQAGEWLVFVAMIVAQVWTMSTKLIGPVLEGALNRDFRVEVSVGPFIRDCIKLNFGNAIEADVLALPRDIGAFGRVNPLRGTFMIAPLQPLILAGGTRDFITVPALTGLVWTAEDLLLSTTDAGTFISDGHYQAPDAGSFRGRFLRVRITATDPASGYHSSALVTVVANGLVLNPLFYECGFEEEVELQAGLLDDGTLCWLVKNPIESERGSVVESQGGLAATYRTAPTQPRKTYVLDEIEVANLSTGQRQSVHVLVLMYSPTVTVFVVPDPSLGEGQVRLQAELGGKVCDITTWDVLLGPGLITLDGVYILNYATPERFAVITVVADRSDPDWVFGEGDGHIVLPLPLAAFPAQLAAFRRDPSAP